MLSICGYWFLFNTFSRKNINKKLVFLATRKKKSQITFDYSRFKSLDEKENFARLFIKKTKQIDMLYPLLVLNSNNETLETMFMVLSMIYNSISTKNLR